MKDLFDKVLFVLLASLLSTYVLYDYNIYSKAFETASSQSRPYSTLAVKLFNVVSDEVSKLNRDLKLNQLLKPDKISSDNLSQMLKIANDIKVNATVLRNAAALQSTFNAPTDVALELATKLRIGAADFSDRNKFNKTTVDNFNTEAEKLQSKFIDSHFEKIGALFSQELSTFKSKFGESVPWDAQPITVLILCLAGVGGYIVYIIFGPKKAPDYT
jgi:hypothetical protein